jgi:NhaP-type Na+/H+ or K+/H+ antiporter
MEPTTNAFNPAMGMAFVIGWYLGSWLGPWAWPACFLFGALLFRLGWEAER